MSTTSMSLPVLITKGNHYQVGRDMGHTFKNQIQTAFAKDALLAETIIPWSQTAKGQQEYADYLRVANDSYPQYVEEMQGIADGSGIPFSQIFLSMHRREALALMGLDKYSTDACSDVLVRQTALHAFGHTEDCETIFDGLSFVVIAEITNDRPRGKLTVPKEAFTCYSYPGTLPGFAFGFNHHGLAFSANAVFPRQVLPSKTGHYILNRAILSASSVDEVKSILEDAGVGTAYGTSVNVADLHCQTLYNIEVVSQVGKKQSRIDVKEITPAGDDHYFHANLYRRYDVDENEQHKPSSEHRIKRFNALPPPCTKRDILGMLGDRGDTEWPIFRQHEKDGSTTTCTAYFDMEKWTMEVYIDNPATSSEPIHTFNIPKQDTV